MAKLMIIESPGKLKKLKAILGPGWQIEASIGHIRDLPKKSVGGGIGVAPPNFTPEYELTERGREVVKKLKPLVERADAVYLATDPDREGEAISWHLQQALKLGSRYERVTFNEITEGAVKSGISKPRKIDDNLVRSQEGRRVIDRLVGYKASPALWQSFNNNSLSAGRVQSPAVRLVVERDRAIRNFRSTTHFGATIFFKEGWSAEWNTKPFVTEEKPYMLDKALADSVSKVRDVVVSSFEDGKEYRNPPPPFTTAKLQMAASRKLGMSPEDTMKAAQKLYEAGAITYHRTDNPNLSEEAMAPVAAELRKLGIDCVAKQRKFKAPEGAQAGHPAITPTHWEVDSAGEDRQQAALYKMIREQALACQAPAAEYATRKAVLDGATQDSQKVQFLANGRTLTHKGWLAVLDGDDTQEKDRDEQEAVASNPVPKLAKGDAQHAENGKVLEQRTEPPAKYTEATLIAKLEKEGIGRPSTYAAIMQNIVSKGLVARVPQRAGKPAKLDSTKTGEDIVDALVGRCQFMEIPYTKSVEWQLDEVSEGKAAYFDVVKGVYEQLDKELSGMEAKQQVDRDGQVVTCPGCGKSMGRRSYKGNAFWGCSGYPSCTVTMDDKNGKAVPRAPKPQASAEFCCADKSCGKHLIRRESTKNKGSFWWGCEGFKDGCKQAYPDKDGKPDYDREFGSQGRSSSSSQVRGGARGLSGRGSGRGYISSPGRVGGRGR
jgi:DNA topoisomerase-1